MERAKQLMIWTWHHPNAKHGECVAPPSYAELGRGVLLLRRIEVVRQVGVHGAASER
jgi:hypothetical protein